MRPVLGVDGCPGGWIGTILLPYQERPQVVVEKSIAKVVAEAQQLASITVVGIDIPIGLPDTTVRKADRLARDKLPGKTSSVFNTVCRDAYEEQDRQLADALNRAKVGQGVGAQSWALRTKILEVDTWVRSGTGLTVVEVHPEVSFAEIVGAPLLSSKKTPLGVADRTAALASVDIEAPDAAPPGAALDDVLDACAVAWTADRVESRAAYSLPHPPERFSDGIPAAIWV
jgi:predicted RNase H-like nuclease